MMLLSCGSDARGSRRFASEQRLYVNRVSRPHLLIGQTNATLTSLRTQCATSSPVTGAQDENAPGIPANKERGTTIPHSGLSLNLWPRKLASQGVVVTT